MYRIEIKRKALKELTSLPTHEQRGVMDAIALLRTNPMAGKGLQGDFKGLRSLRVWPYRIIYAVDHAVITVTVLRVRHRKNVYE
jgi:mRNA interferase RelE/StbE